MSSPREDEAQAEGCLDGLADGRIRGWAWYPAAPERIAIVELLHGDDVVATTTAGGERADLEAAGKRGGVCGFEFQIDALPRGVPLRARVFDGDALPGAPVTLDGGEAAPISHEAAVARTAPPLHLPLSGPRLSGYLDLFGPERITGWAMRPNEPHHSVSLAIYADGELCDTLHATSWRPDLFEYRQGDGRCGIDVAVPPALRGGAHSIDIRDAETGHSVIAHPVTIQFGPRLPEASAAPTAPSRVQPSGPPLFSIIVNFYNMQREAERTLTSLTRSYQRGVDDIAYEVLCIDNGSKPPMDPAWVESFGPEFRLFKPSKSLPSPCFALNEAARHAKGKHLAIMIDGAHVLTQIGRAHV